ncbi:MAG: GtrA family protein [Paracoccaceae bacterium]
MGFCSKAFCDLQKGRAYAVSLWFPPFYHQTCPDVAGPARTRVLKPTELILRYSAFAAIAIGANLAAQRLVLSMADGMSAYVMALVVGTGIGLVVKYLLDKRWIFHDRLAGAVAETRKFSLYTLTGVGTTLLFWGSETLFWMIWQTDGMREIGALIGLIAGYTIKYRLDRRFVFPPDPSGPV